MLSTFFPNLVDNVNNYYKYKFVGMPVRKEIEKISNKKYEVNDKE